MFNFNKKIMTIKIWDNLKEAYSLIHSEKIEEAKKAFEEIYNLIDKEEIVEWSDIFNNYISCLLWLWEIYMKQRDSEKSLEYYKEWYKLTNWKDFNILFNLWVVYHNLWKTKEADEILSKAKEINSNDPNLIRFLWEIWEDWDVQNSWKINKDFEQKVQKMIKELT